MKNYSDTIGNWTRDLVACSAVPQPTALPRGYLVDSVKTITFLQVAVFSAIEVHRTLGGMCCLHHYSRRWRQHVPPRGFCKFQPVYDPYIQEDFIFVVTVIMISNFQYCIHKMPPMERTLSGVTFCDTEGHLAPCQTQNWTTIACWLCEILFSTFLANLLNWSLSVPSPTG